MAYYVRNAKWWNRESKSEYTSYSTLSEARVAAARLLSHEYYDGESVPIYIKKSNRYSIYAFVREVIGSYEGEDEDIPVGSSKFVYRTASGTECLMSKSGELGKTRWRSWFKLEYPRH